MFNLPNTTVVNKAIPKTKFYEKTKADSKLKQLFIDDIEQIIWKNKLSKDTINLDEGKKVKEIEIERAMIDRIKDVLIELGKGFAFVGEQYKITVSEKDYFIDLLFYHLKLKCYVVVELKAREFEPTDAGQLNFYLSAIDDLVKDETDNATIGLLLCKNKDNFTAEYALRNISSPIGVSEYKLLEDMPEYLQSQLPKAEDIELHIKAMEDIEKQETQEEIN